MEKRKYTHIRELESVLLQIGVCSSADARKRHQSQRNRRRIRIEP